MRFITKTIRCTFLPVGILFCTVVHAQTGTSTINTKQIGNPSRVEIKKIGGSSLPVCLPNQGACAGPYIFTGNGNWSVEANWLGGLVPPPALPAGKTIIIKPISGGECILNVQQTIAAGATLQVANESRFVVMKNLVYQQ